MMEVRDGKPSEYWLMEATRLAVGEKVVFQAAQPTTTCARGE